MCQVSLVVKYMIVNTCFTDELDSNLKVIQSLDNS